jgi:hypothetical protein
MASGESFDVAELERRMPELIVAGTLANFVRGQ